MDMEQLLDLTKIKEHECGFYHAEVRPCPSTFRDDAMGRRCCSCERIVRQCLCEWGRGKNIAPNETQLEYRRGPQ